MPFTESVVEEAALAWLREIGYTLRAGPDIAPGEPAAERASYADVVLTAHLDEKLADLNPGVPAATLAEARRRLLQPASQSLIVNNRAFHRRLVDGVEVEVKRSDGSIQGVRVRIVDS